MPHRRSADASTHDDVSAHPGVNAALIVMEACGVRLPGCSDFGERVRFAAVILRDEFQAAAKLDYTRREVLRACFLCVLELEDEPIERQAAMSVHTRPVGDALPAPPTC